MEQPQTDWNDVWKCTYNNSTNQHSNERVKFWDSKENALNYLKESINHTDRVNEILRRLPLSPEFRVLDIGSGPGNMTIPMSTRVAHITAVEPGKGMMEILKEQIAEHNVHNITTVQKRWEVIDIARDLDGPYDLVIASHSLGMPDMRDAIQKMCMASRKWVYLFWVAGINTWEWRVIDLWPRLHGCEYKSGPKADILYHLLYDMQIYPNVTSEQRDIAQIYPDMDAAVYKFRKSFNISTPEQEKIVWNYLKETLETSEDGYFHRGRSYPVTFWWNVLEIDERVRNSKKL